MAGMSFREFLLFEKDIDLPIYSFEQILSSHQKISGELSDIPGLRKLFSEYLACGYYPFYFEDRETFFLSMLHGANHSPLYATRGDYTCNDITFEIGGKNKGFEQVSNLETKAFVVKDDILQSDGKRSIPLYLWGFLY
jgi:hypothetical protein